MDHVPAPVLVLGAKRPRNGFRALYCAVLHRENL